MTETQIKAREIVIKMQFQKRPLIFEQAKQCALIAVDEIIDALDKSLIDLDIAWWQEVKQEIEKL